MNKSLEQKIAQYEALKHGHRDMCNWRVDPLVKDLIAEVRRLEEDNYTLKNYRLGGFSSLVQENTLLKKQLERAKKGLDWFANKHNWKQNVLEPDQFMSAGWAYKGNGLDIAKQALKDIEEMETELGQNLIQAAKEALKDEKK